MNVKEKNYEERVFFMKDKRKKKEQNLQILPDEIRPISEEMTMEEKNRLTSHVLQHMKQINEQTQKKPKLF